MKSLTFPVFARNMNTKDRVFECTNKIPVQMMFGVRLKKTKMKRIRLK